jgi:hypothetical protein
MCNVLHKLYDHSLRACWSAYEKYRKKSKKGSPYMRDLKWLAITVLAVAAMASSSFGSESNTNEGLSSIIEALKYFRSIHIMAMLLVGFGFLMVFVKKFCSV